jgi:hypothetical protein
MPARMHPYTRMHALHGCTFIRVYGCKGANHLNMHPCILHTYLQARGITAPVLLSLKRENISAASQNLDARVSIIMSELTENRIKPFKT